MYSQTITQAESSAKTANLRVAVVGSGYWGKNLIRNFHHLDALEVICDKNDCVLEAFKRQYPDVTTCLAYSEVLRNDAVDAVVLATPAETHHRLAWEALQAGKHVFVEKPLTLDESEGVKLIRLAEETGLTLMVGHLLQHHPIFIHLLNIARQGELGRINYIYSNRLNLGKIRREENALWSFAPHDISMILALAGEEPARVSAVGGYYLHDNIADVTTTHLEFRSGMKAHVFVSWLHPFKEQKLVVVGDRKMAVFDDTLPWEDKLLLYPHRINWENNIPVADKAAAERVDVPEAEPLRAECAHFLRCASRRERPVTDGAEGLRVLKVLNKAQSCLDREKSESRHSTSGVHETALIEDGTKIGRGTTIWHYSHILPGSSLGENCRIGRNVVIGPDAVVGDGCKIQNNVSVYKGVTLEDGVFCGPSMVFTNVYNPRCHIPRMHELRETLVKKGATLGANCTIVCGNTIGRYAFVGAGAVVTRDVPDHALMTGNPARRAGWMCACGERLDHGLHCAACGAAYAESDSGLVPLPLK